MFDIISLVDDRLHMVANGMASILLFNSMESKPTYCPCKRLYRHRMVRLSRSARSHRLHFAGRSKDELSSATGPSVFRCRGLT